MNQNPNQRFQQQFQKQMADQRQRQMQAAWAQQQQQAGTYPVRERGGCARLFSFFVTLIVSGVGFLLLCGGAGYFAVGLATNSEETAVAGLVAGGIVAVVLALVVAIRAARR